MAGEKVWALHDFEAENPDEVSFKAGECIIVIEKDDAYGDGWWQGTNIRGESGLFPFTYTTLDQSQALVAQTGSSSAEPGTTPQQASNKPGVMHSTMADIDNALTELQSDRRRGRKSIDAPDGSRASFTSERTADMTNDDASEIYNPSSDDYASRSAAARAALAVNAQRDLQSAQEKERQDEQRRREEAMREFEKEEARQRDLLLEKERERQAQAAAGTLDFSRDDKPKVAPIAGVDMSDESDSEGSAGDLDDFGDKTHSPLFGNLASATAQKPSEDAGRAGGSSLKNVVEPLPEETPDEAAAAEDATAAPPASSPAAPAVAAAAADAAEPEIVPPSSAQPEAAPTPAAAPTATADADSSAGPVAAMTAGVGAVALGATAGTITITSRSTSPVPLAHRKADPSTDSKPTDQRSVDESSRGRGSLADESVAGGTGTVGTAATSLAGGGPETPKSTGVPFSTSVQSPSQSVTSGPRPADPTEWTVEQVVEWGRSKGWDENSVLSKFVEHEITGDVLLEMDVNILKEIDIIAFGKRFQVANAIKELRKMVPGAEQLATPAISGMPGSPGGLGVQSAAPFSPTDALMPPQSPHAPAPGPTGPGSWADSQSVKQRVADASYDSSALNGSHSRPASSIGEGVSSNGQAYTGAGGIAAWQAQQASQRSRVPSQNPSEGYSNDDDEPLAALAERQLGAKNRRSTRSNEDTLGALPASPRKRESAGSSSHSRGGGGDRTSFFGIGQRNRKPPPKVMAPGSVAEDERHGKGTLSRLGFARSSRSIPSQAASNSDMKNAISLPTTSPNFDGNGDMARRSRMSAQSGTSTGTAEPKHGRAASVGSAGAGAQPNDWTAAAAGVGPGAANNAAANSEGPVMARIRPVDLEGWMRKKGERYNSWKPRYLALKGSDLVILRDPQAEKIKGYVSMKGYKVIADENTNPGKYGFKILHETEKPHYFSSEDPILVREWMKGLMKATIGRDHSFPVISSYNNATMSLKEAQRMNPPPRPPSPTSRARTQRAKARQNTDQLTARDAAILMNLSGGQPTTPDATGLPRSDTSPTKQRFSSMPKSQGSLKNAQNRLSAFLGAGSKPLLPARSPSRRLAPDSKAVPGSTDRGRMGSFASSRVPVQSGQASRNVPSPLQVANAPRGGSDVNQYAMSHATPPTYNLGQAIPELLRRSPEPLCDPMPQGEASQEEVLRTPSPRYGTGREGRQFASEAAATPVAFHAPPSPGVEAFPAAPVAAGAYRQLVDSDLPGMQLEDPPRFTNEHVRARTHSDGSRARAAPASSFPAWADGPAIRDQTQEKGVANAYPSAREAKRSFQGRPSTAATASPLAVPSAGPWQGGGSGGGVGLAAGSCAPAHSLPSTPKPMANAGGSTSTKALQQQWRQNQALPPSSYPHQYAHPPPRSPGVGSGEFGTTAATEHHRRLSPRPLQASASNPSLPIQPSAPPPFSGMHAGAGTRMTMAFPSRPSTTSNMLPSRPSTATAHVGGGGGQMHGWAQSGPSLTAPTSSSLSTRELQKRARLRSQEDLRERRG